jgi:hypothetical protein
MEPSVAVGEPLSKNTDARTAFTSIRMPARAHACFTTPWVFCRTGLALV